MAIYPIIDEPERQPDDTFIIRIHSAPGQTREFPAKDRKSARDLYRFLLAAAGALVPPPEPEVRREGRPLKLTPVIIKKCVEGFTCAISYESVAARAGVSLRSLHRWLEEGERAAYRFENEGDQYEETEDDRMRREFWHSAKKALAQCEYDLAVEAKRCNRKSRDAIIFLGRRFRKDWERRIISEDDGAHEPVRVVFREMIADPHDLGDTIETSGGDDDGALEK